MKKDPNPGILLGPKRDPDHAGTIRSSLSPHCPTLENRGKIDQILIEKSTKISKTKFW